MSLITAIIAKQGDFMQGGPVALMQYVLFPFQMNTTHSVEDKERQKNTQRGNIRSSFSSYISNTHLPHVG